MGISPIVLASYLPRCLHIVIALLSCRYIIANNIFHVLKYREQEKGRRWQEIRLRQNRLRADNVTRNATLEQTMLKSGFTMSDINGNIMCIYFRGNLKIQ